MEYVIGEVLVVNNMISSRVQIITIPVVQQLAGKVVIFNTAFYQIIIYRGKVIILQLIELVCYVIHNDH